MTKMLLVAQSQILGDGLGAKTNRKGIFWHMKMFCSKFSLLGCSSPLMGGGGRGGGTPDVTISVCLYCILGSDVLECILPI